MTAQAADSLAGSTIVGGVCELAVAHRPRYLTVEAHHVIPRGWQTHFMPSFPPPAATPGTYAGIGLWDARTVTVCPTHHRNTHWWIVALTRAYVADGPASVDDAAARVRTHGRRAAELPTARLALDRFLAAGGDLVALAHAGEWGQS